MRIVSAEYTVSAVKPDQYPRDNLPEIALVGRSNVGKSSFINTVTGRKSLARISGQPGKTRTLNFYRINNAFYLVDLPGYGFARVSQEAKRQWAYMINTYLQNRRELCFIIQLVDIRHEPTADDLQMYSWLKEYDAPRAVIATKADKISRGRYLKHTGVIRDKLGMAANETLIVFSAVNRTGLEEALATLREAVEGQGDEE